MENTNARTYHNEEKQAPAVNGMPMLILICLLAAILIAGFVLCLQGIAATESQTTAIGKVFPLLYSPLSLVIICICLFAAVPLICAGLKVLKPNEAYVLTLFGRYHGTLRGPGFFFVNPFVTAATPTAADAPQPAAAKGHNSGNAQAGSIAAKNKKVSLKTMTLNNDRQKINDLLGNPIEIGIVVIWRVVNTAKAIFNVDNYGEFLSIQCDSALRGIVRLYPYDIAGDEDEGERSLRGSSQEVADGLKTAIQEKVNSAGIEIIEARITHLAYAQEIAAAMLQRQQAAAVIAARSAIVKGAVDMVEMALSRLSEHDIVDLDNERKAAMVSNLLVVLCGNKDIHPVVNSGSLY
jgi:regulator of protease activity HflC (stomatin/prohibitin superfamily)